MWLIWNKGKQIGDANVHAGLRKQSRGLAAVVRLMVEEVHHQRKKAPVRDHALDVCILQEVIEVRVCNRLRPIHGDPLERASVVGEALHVGMQKPIETGRGWKISHRIE